MSVQEKTQKAIFTKEELKEIDLKRIPKHIAFIPDGNRRWAKTKRIRPDEGHKIGADILLNVIMASFEIGIETLTFYIFSTENWSRPKREIKAQMWLLEKSLIEQKKRMLDNGVKFQAIGRLAKFPEHIRQLIHDTIDATRHCDKITVVFAMNYGGRDDITRALSRVVQENAKALITEELISSYLDTAPFRDPDLLIRTSGEARLSNFLLWQLSYTEIYFTKTLWPEFSPHHLLEAVLEYQNRERRLGG